MTATDATLHANNGYIVKDDGKSPANDTLQKASAEIGVGLKL